MSIITLGLSIHAFCGEIHDAANAKYLAKVKALLEENPEFVSSRDDNGQTPLHSAVVRNNKDVAALLLANKADVNAKDDTGHTPLHSAVLRYQTDLAELLLANKADINAKDNLGMTALHTAAFTSRKDEVELLLAKGAHINDKNNNGQTPLNLAVRSGQKDVAELLLKHLALLNNYQVNNQQANNQAYYPSNIINRQISLEFKQASVLEIVQALRTQYSIPISFIQSMDLAEHFERPINVSNKGSLKQLLANVVLQDHRYQYDIIDDHLVLYPTDDIYQRQVEILRFDERFA